MLAPFAVQHAADDRQFRPAGNFRHSPADHNQQFSLRVTIEVHMRVTAPSHNCDDSRAACKDNPF